MSTTYRVISYDMGKKLANEWNSAFVESSAKQNEVKGWSDSPTPSDTPHTYPLPTHTGGGHYLSASASRNRETIRHTR